MIRWIAGINSGVRTPVLPVGIRLDGMKTPPIRLKLKDQGCDSTVLVGGGDLAGSGDAYSTESRSSADGLERAPSSIDSRDGYGLRLRLGFGSGLGHHSDMTECEG